jgi:hypothetical protein
MSDYKLNKYLAKLKNAQDLKKANVYIAKILKYKQMGGQNGGAEPADPIVSDITETSRKIKELMTQAKGDQEHITEIKTAILSKAGNIDASNLETELKRVFTGMKDLFKEIGDLKPDELDVEKMLVELNTKMGDGEKDVLVNKLPTWYNEAKPTAV